MRVLGRIILWSLIFTIAWWAISNSFSYFNWNQAQQVAWEKEYNAYTSYWLNPNKDLSFDIPANAAQIRIIVVSKQLEPAVQNNQSELAGPNIEQQLISNIPLTFEFVSRNASQNLVISHMFNRDDMQQNEVSINQLNQEQHSNVADRQQQPINNKEEQATEHTNELPLRFFDSPSGARASFGQVAYLDNKQYANLSIRAENITSQQVSVRVAILEKKLASDLAVAWQRMHKKTREELLEEHIFPVDLVSEYEKKEALRYRWLPIGPNGTEEDDYTTTRLYVHANLVPAPTQQQLETKVLQNWSNQDERFTFEHTQQNPYQLSCDSQPLPKWISIRYQSTDLQTNKHWFFQGKQLEKSIAIPPLDGRFEVQSENFCSIVLTDSDGKIVEDNSNLLRAYRVDSKQAIIYQLAGDHPKNQPIRVDFRALIEPGEHSLVDEISSGSQLEPLHEFYNVDWQLYDAQDNLLLSGSESLPLYNNRYETLDPARADYLKAKASIYVQAPPKASKLVIQSQQVALVNAYSRPVDLAFAVTQDNRPYQDVPKWFSIKPQAAEQLIINQRSELIDIRKRLIPQQPEQLLQQLVQLSPADSHLNFELLEAAQSEQHQSWHYHRFAKGDVANLQMTHQMTHQTIELEQQLNFFNDSDKHHVDASIVYRTSANNLPPFKVNVHIDGEVIADFWVSQKSGKINLPPIQAGQHSLTLSSASKYFDWYINRSRPTTNNSERSISLFRLRQVYPIKKKATFIFEKQTESEWLTFLFYPKITEDSLIEPNFQAMVSIEPLQVHDVASSHTVASRKYYIEQATTATAQVQTEAIQLLNQKNAKLNQSVALKFPVESDVKNGTYRVTFELLDGQGLSQNGKESGYIQSYYVKDDVQQKIIYFNESIYD